MAHDNSGHDHSISHIIRTGLSGDILSQDIEDKLEGFKLQELKIVIWSAYRQLLKVSWRCWLP